IGLHLRGGLRVSELLGELVGRRFHLRDGGLRPLRLRRRRALWLLDARVAHGFPGNGLLDRRSLGRWLAGGGLVGRSREVLVFRRRLLHVVQGQLVSPARLQPIGLVRLALVLVPEHALVGGYLRGLGFVRQGLALILFLSQDVAEPGPFLPGHLRRRLGHGPSGGRWSLGGRLFGRLDGLRCSGAVIFRRFLPHAQGLDVATPVGGQQVIGWWEIGRLSGGRRLRFLRRIGGGRRRLLT